MKDAALTAARAAGWTNRAHAGVFRKGWEARQRGEPVTACPYRRHPGGGVYNGTAAWGRAWRAGWHQAPTCSEDSPRCSEDSLPPVAQSATPV